MRITIIGGSGYCGSHLALVLQRRGHEVTCLDSLEVNNLVQWSADEGPYRERSLRILNGRMDMIRAAGIPLLVVDARDYARLSRALANARPEVIVHLAAVSHMDKSNKDPYSTFDHSLRTLENALDYARGAGLGHFLFQSSSTVYGHIPEEARETDRLEPIGTYANLKLAAERMVIAYHQVSGLPYTIIRPSALYGPWCVSRRVVQVFIEAALNGEPLQVMGDGSDRLDFTYIEDWGAGMVGMIEQEAAKNQIFNLTYGRSRSLMELVEIVREFVPGVRVASRERSALIPRRNTLSIARIRGDVGYAPEWPLERGVREYVRWYREQQIVPAGGPRCPSPALLNAKS